MGFYNDIVKIQVDAGMHITAEVTERNTGVQAICTEEWRLNKNPGKLLAYRGFVCCVWELLD